MSWTIFYYEMQTHMLKQTISQASPIPTGKGFAGKTKSFVKGQVMDSIVDAQSFAAAFCNAYDKTVKTGKTLIGGVPVSDGNKKVMQAILISEMLIAKASGKLMFNTLLDLCGTAVQAYWTGAGIAKFPVPNVPCITTVANITTTKAYNLSPGKWTSIVVGPQVAFEPFLLSFIASAMLHCLTLGGIFICNCQYPPPAPPAPGVLPWVGYFVAPPTAAGGLLKKALLKTVATRKQDIKSLAKLVKDKALANQKLLLGIVGVPAVVALAGYGSVAILDAMAANKLPEYLATPAGQLDHSKLQAAGISQQMAAEMGAQIYKNGAPVFEDVANVDSQPTEQPKSPAQKVKDGDIKKQVNKINNTTNQDVSNTKTLQKNLAESFKTPSSGDIGKIIPTSVTPNTSILIESSFNIAYDKIKSSTLSNLQRIDLLDNVTKTMAKGLPIENIDELIQQKQNNKTKG